jgi:cytochrome c oxidase subunit 2
MSRQTIAAGTLPNTAADLGRWISQTQAVKPGSEMPVVSLTATELGSVVAYLQTLH